jgi:hypothetical protein
MSVTPFPNPKFAFEEPQVCANFGFAAPTPVLRNLFRKRIHA